MAKDVIARLKVEHSQWDSGFGKAGKTLKDFEAKNLSMAGAMDQGMKALASSAAKYVGWGAAVAGAMKVAKDAFMANEQQLDEWGRIQQSAEGAYKGLLNALNNGDISGYLSNINQIISAAREAYNALDELGTFKAFNQVNQARNKAGYSEALEAYKANPTAENKKALSEANTRVLQDLKDEAGKQNAAYEAALEELFRGRGLTGDALKEAKRLFKEGSYADILKAKKGYKKLSWSESWDRGYIGQMDTYNGKQVTDVNGQGRWVEGSTSRAMTAADDASYQLSRAMQQVNDTEIDAVQKLGAQAFALEQAQAEQNRSFNRMAGNNRKVGGSGSGKGSKATTIPAKEEITYAEDSIAGLTAKIKEYQAAQQLATNNTDWQTLEGKIQDAQSQIDQITGKAWEVKLPDEKDFSTASLGNFSSFASDLQKQMSEINITDSLYANLQEQLADTTALQNIIKTALENGLNFEEIGLDVEGLWSSLLNEEGIENCDWDAIVNKINEKLAEKGIQITFNANTGNVSEQKTDNNQQKQSGQSLIDKGNQLVSGMSQLNSGLKGLGINLGEGFDKFINGLSSVMQIVNGVKTIIDIFQIPSQAANTAALVANTAALNVNSAFSLFPFAEGGIVHAAEGWGGMVGGNSYVGDTIPILANAGEVVLNAAQQQNLAEGLYAAGAGSSSARTTISGEQLVTVINNYGKRTGRGEILR